MLNCRKVAVTGTVSSGKSTVCRILRELGAYVVDADAIVHRLLAPDTELGKQVLALLDSDVLVDGRFDRAKIAQKVFNNPARLSALESILHPAVEKEIAAEYQQINTQNSVSLFVAEIPLLFESGSEGFYDWVVVVAADEASCKKRFIEKTQYGEQDFLKRTNRLIPLAEKKQRADFVLINDGTLSDLKDSVRELYPKLLARRK